MKIRLSNLQPNPYRDLAQCPLNEDKITALTESMKTTDWWGGLVGRKNKDGVVEVAFGHHRLAAARKVFGKDYEIDMQVRPLTDAQMIQMMVRENNESYATTVAALLQSLRVAVKARGNGQISDAEMPVPSNTKDDLIRVAPFFSMISESSLRRREHPYTAQGLAQFLGMTQKNGDPQEKFLAAFTALELMELGYMKESQVKELGSKHLYSTVRAIQNELAAAKKEQARLEAEAQRHRENAKLAEQERVKAEIQRKAELVKAEQEENAKKSAKMRQAADKKAQQAKETASKAEQAATEATETAKNNATTVKKQMTAVVSAVTAAVIENKVGYREVKDVAQEVFEETRPFAGKNPKDDDEFKVFAAKVAAAATQKREPRIDSMKSIRKASLEIANEGYRSLAKKAHPDAGGNAEAMARLSTAIKWLRNLIEESD